MRQGHIKICLLGDAGAGKTSLVRRWAYNTFDRAYSPSRSLTVSTKTVVLRWERSLLPHTLVLWDPASTLFSALPYAAFLDEADAVILAADAASEESAKRLRDFVEPVRRFCPQAHLLIAATKVDLAAQGYPVESPALAGLQQLAHEAGAIFHHTSALRDAGIELLFRTLAHVVAQVPDRVASHE